jgi:hypothetical protein
MAKKSDRVDNSDWKNSSPKTGTGQSWRQWAMENPNRKASAKKAIRETDPNDPDFIATTTSTRTGSKAREVQVGKWQGARPVSGKGGAKSPSEKEAKRQKMIQWAQWNPNKRSNAQRVVKKKNK